VERVARALCPIDPDSTTQLIVHDKWYRAGTPHWQSWIAEARVAIAAMREPTEAMVKEACNVSIEMSANQAHLAWQAMIDDALKERASR